MAEFKSSKEATQEAKENASKTNDTIDKAAAEASKELEKQVEARPDDAPAPKQRFNTIDAKLGLDEKHGEAVKEAQKDTNAAFTAEAEKQVVTPAPSQNQNNLKHPESKEYVDVNAAKNYLGQPL